MIKNKVEEFIYGNKINLMLKGMKDNLKIVNAMEEVCLCGMMVLDIKVNFITGCSRDTVFYIGQMGLNNIKVNGRMEHLMVKVFNYFRMARFTRVFLKMINSMVQVHL